MVERTIVAVDGGEASEAAVRWVADRATRRELAIDLTSVIPMDERATQRPHHEAALSDARRIIRSAAERTPLKGGPARHAVSERVRHGDTVEQLVDASKEADLLVVGTNRTSGIASLLHLTIPLQLAGRVHCALVVVPAGWQPGEGPVVVGWEDDGSSEDAVAFAAREAASTGQELLIVHSWVLPPVNAFDPEGSAALYTDVAGTQHDLLDRKVREVREAYPGLKVHSDLTPNSADVALARMGSRAALLVVGSHGGGAVVDLFRGSVGDELIRAMAAPVMIMPVPDRQPIEIYQGMADEEL